MERTVCIVTLSSESAPIAARMLVSQTDCESSAVITCKNEADFAATAVSERADVIFAAAEPRQFIKAKLHLIKALACKVVRSSAVVAAMGENAPENAKERDVHAAMPHSAQVYTAPGGLFSSFSYKKADGSTLVFLPLDADTVRRLFEADLAAYKAKPAYEEKSAAEEKQPEVRQPEPKPVYQEKPQAPAVKDFKQDIISFIASGKSVAVAEEGCYRAFLSVVSKFRGSQASFVSAKAEVSDQETPELAAAALAKAAKEEGYTDYGASISEITETNDGERFITVALADANGANLAKVYAEPGEDDKRLAGAAMIKLFEMIGNVSEAGKVEKPAAAGHAIVSTAKQGKKSRLPLILALSGVAAAAVISAIIAFVD